MDFFIKLSKLIILLPKLNKEAGNHRYNNEGYSRGKSYTLRHFFLTHQTALLINVISKNFIL